MDLQSVIKNMEEGSVKSAAAQPAPSAQEQNLTAALEKAAGDTAPSAAQPVDAVAALMKTANELAGAEKEAEVAHAALCGQAFADGAVAKFAQYDVQAQQAGLAKEASIPGDSGSDDAFIKAAAEQGYADANEKIAADYQAGHDEIMQNVHDQAAGEFLKGAAEVDIMVQRAQQVQ